MREKERGEKGGWRVIRVRNFSRASDILQKRNRSLFLRNIKRDFVRNEAAVTDAIKRAFQRCTVNFYAGETSAEIFSLFLCVPFFAVNAAGLLYVLSTFAFCTKTEVPSRAYLCLVPFGSY